MITTQDRTKELRVTVRGGWRSVTSCLLQTREEMKCEQTRRKGFKGLGHSVKLESRAGKKGARELPGQGVFTGGGPWSL